MSIGYRFMIETRYEYLEESPQQKREPQPPLETPVDSSLPRVKLPAPESVALAPVDLRALIDQRRTVRNYANAPVSLDELALLLWATQGVKEQRDAYATLRTVPSAGARHAFETFLMANNVSGLDPALYRYLALSRELVTIDTSAGIAQRITTACLSQEQVARSAVTLVWVAVAERMTWRYVERGYRYLHLDAGHVCQNLYLMAEAIHCGVCAIAAFNDAELNDVLGVDGKAQFAIYVASVGKKRA